MKRKKVGKIFLIIMMVGGLESLSLLHVPTTQTRYYDYEDNALLYKTNLYTLYKGNFYINTNGASNYRDIVLEFSFSRNNVVTDNSRDVYEVVVPSGCTINSITSLSGSGNGKEIVYQTPTSDKINVRVRCTVNQVVKAESIYVPISVYEKVENESKFLYMEGLHKQSLVNYRVAHPIPTVDLKDNSITVPSVSQNRYHSFLEQIRLWASVNAPTVNPNTVINYVKSVYPDEASLFDLSRTLPGFKVEKMSESLHDNYIFTIQENFVGYARTFATHVSAPRFMYFSTQVKTEIEKAFSYYLSHYTYPNDDYAVQMVLDYVKRNDGIASFVLPDKDGNYKTLLGFTYDEDLNQLILDNLLVDIATPVIKSPMPIRFGTALDMRKQFNIKLPKAYGEKVISSTAAKEILKNSKVKESITKNNQTVEKKTNFKDQYLYYDKINEHYLLFDIYSSVEDSESDTNNYVKFSEPIAFTKEVAKFQNNEDGSLQVTINGMSKEEILKEIERINQALDASVLEKDILFETRKDEEEEEYIVATYSIQKKITAI